MASSQARAKVSLAAARDAFFAEARWQGCCQVNGDTGVDWDPHHVVRWQDLKRMGLPRYDRRNALRLSGQVHANHTNGSHKIHTIKLLDCNIDYAVEIMGAERAAQYLRRYYDDTTEPDPRLEVLCPTI